MNKKKILTAGIAVLALTGVALTGCQQRQNGDKTSPTQQPTTTDQMKKNGTMDNHKDMKKNNTMSPYGTDKKSNMDSNTNTTTTSPDTTN